MGLRVVLQEIGVAEYIFGRLLPRFVEPVHIQLPDEAVDVLVSEVFGQDCLLELVDVLDREFFPVARPLDNLAVLVVLN